MRNIYEYTFGVYVEADNEQDAWEKVRAVSETLDTIDVEGDSVTEGPRPLDGRESREITRKPVKAERLKLS